MLPYIHIGPLTLGTFGILTAIGFLVSYAVLRADLWRRGLPDVADNIVLLSVVAGMVGAKLYNVLETPRELLDHPVGAIFSRSGFAWAGGLIGGILAIIFLARRYRWTLAGMFDLCSPAAAIGYAVGRIGCLISGDGDYGVPTNLPWGMSFPNGIHPTIERVHPTPIYEFLAGLVIFYYLWKLGARSLRQPRPEGEIIGEYFLWTGLARFLVEFIRINPPQLPAPSFLIHFVNHYLRIPENLGIDTELIHNPRFTGFSNAQVLALLSIIVGAAILLHIKRNFKRQKQEHKVLAHVDKQGPTIQTEYSKSTPECPHPERWRMLDSLSAEVEVLEFLQCLVTMLKPNLVLETGTFMGVSTLRIAEGLKANGFGKVITCEVDPVVFAKAKQRIDASGLAQWIEYRNESSLETKITGTIDILFSDSAWETREPEVRHFLAQINTNGIILMHDASSHLKTVREAALRLEREGLISVLLLPTPRGLVMAQKREGRK